jgi:hypothetical protein
MRGVGAPSRGAIRAMTRVIWRHTERDERYLVELSTEGGLVKAASVGGGDLRRLLNDAFPPEPATLRRLADSRGQFTVEYELD